MVRVCQLLVPVVASACLGGCLWPIDVGSFGRQDQRALEGAPCAADGDCTEGLACADGACVAVPDPACSSDADCDGPTVCSAGVCERAPCSSDADCAGGFCDRDGLCSVDTTTGPLIVIGETGQGMGEVVVGGASVGDTVIENAGDLDLVIDSATFEGDGADQFFVATSVIDNGDGTATVNDMAPALAAPFVIPPLASATLFEIFQPNRIGDFTVDLVLHSNDATNPELRVGLRGVGVEQPSRP